MTDRVKRYLEIGDIVASTREGDFVDMTLVEEQNRLWDAMTEAEQRAVSDEVMRKPIQWEWNDHD
jgi:hypothetical protein